MTNKRVLHGGAKCVFEPCPEKAGVSFRSGENSLPPVLCLTLKRCGRSACDKIDKNIFQLKAGEC